MNILNCIPHVAGNEIKYLKECIDTGWISPVGPFVDRFERNFADYHGIETAAAVSSGTAAIHLGLLALEVKKGDLVLCPTITFIGTVNPICYIGAEPVFLEVEEKTLNIDPQCLSYFLKNETEIREKSLIYKSTGQKIAALIVVHLYGNPADMDALMSLSEEYNLPVLEDAAESLGARYKGKLVGTIGDISCFSFNGNKVNTTGGGGMIISKNTEKTKLCKHLSTQAKIDPFEFIHDMVGFNYRISNLCAAVGVAQMERLDDFIMKKREHAMLYKKLLEGNSHWDIIDEPEGCYGTYWMVLCRFKNGDVSVIEKIRQLSKNGLGVRPIWHPIQLLPLYRNSIYFGDDISGKLYPLTFCLPSSVGLTDEEISQVVEVLIKL